MNPLPRTMVVMGVSGCGKSLIGSQLAQAIGADFEDGDDFHPVSNKAKMSTGSPLTDEDRWPWYEILRKRIVAHRATGKVFVLACSSLKQSYRDRLRDTDSAKDVIFIHLKASRDIVGPRMAGRQGHFMPPALLDSQFATLEEPRDAITMDAALPPDEIVRRILQHFC